MSHRFAIALTLKLPVIQTATPAQSESANWPQFRGSTGGVAAENSSPPLEFGETRNFQWKTALPSGSSSPCIWGDYIFLTAYDGEHLETIGLRRDDGEILWRRRVPAPEIEQFPPAGGTPAASTPATDGERVYVYFGSYGMVTYDFEGNEMWKVPMSTADTEFGSGTSPIVEDDLVLLNRDERADSHLLALDRRTGEVVWRTERPDFLDGYSSPGRETAPVKAPFS